MSVHTINLKVLKRQIDKILKQAEDEALAEGRDITSTEIQVALMTLKRRILETKGVSIEEYEAFETLMEDEEVTTNVAEGVSFSVKVPQVKQLREEIDKLKEEFINEIRNIGNKMQADKTQTDKSLQGLAASALTETQVKEFVKPMIPSIPEQVLFDDTDIKSDIEMLSQQFRDAMEDYAQRLVDLLGEVESRKAELLAKIHKNRPQFSTEEQRYLKNLADPDKLAESIEIFTMEPFRKLAMGLQSQIDAISYAPKEETPTGDIDGSNKSYTLTNTPSSNSLHLYRNGQYQTAGGKDYTLSGKTITMVTAPRSGNVLTAKYST